MTLLNFIAGALVGLGLAALAAVGMIAWIVRAIENDARKR